MFIANNERKLQELLEKESKKKGLNINYKKTENIPTSVAKGGGLGNKAFSLLCRLIAKGGGEGKREPHSPLPKNNLPLHNHL